MPPTVENDANVVPSGIVSDDDNAEAKVESTLHNMNSPTVPKSHRVVGRLSRWEGGNAYDKDLFSTPAHGRVAEEKTNGSEREASADPERRSVTLSDFLRVFHRDDEILEVANEDIERVKMMHEKFLEESKLCFNYNSLLIIASLLAGLGLGGNSVATIIASMLVSPLMGPVVGMAYANTICDYKMFRIAIVTEILSLMVCICTGAVVAAFMLPFQITDDWPAPEMYNRGSSTSFWLGFPIAFFSGLGVAVSLLDDQTSSLVGVAISASLLPPAVNSGMMWVSYLAYNPDTHSYDEEWDKHDFRVMGLYSLGLTLINIVLIIIASMIMFRLKERLPIKKNIFWSDLGVARKIYRNLAIIPRVQTGPSPEELEKRVSQLMFPGDRNFDFSSYEKRDKSARPVRNSRFHVPHGTDGESQPAMPRISE